MPKATFFNLPDAKRQRIVELAIEEFASHPYRQASISRIVARAGIAKGSLYQYFADKLELYRWLVLDVANAELDGYVASQNIPPDADFFTRLQLVSLANLQFYHEKPHMARLAASLLDAGNDPEVSTTLAAHRNIITERLQNMVERAKASGELRPDLDAMIAAQVIIAVLGDALTNILLNRMNSDLFTMISHPERLPSLEPEVVVELVAHTLNILRMGMAAPRRPLPKSELAPLLPQELTTMTDTSSQTALEAQGPAHARIIYKICHQSEWAQALAQGEFTGSAVDLQDGFIHLSDASQVKETARRYFAGREGLVLVAVDTQAVQETLRWEPSRGGALFPHIYGPLPVSAALWVQALPLTADGSLLFPDSLA